MAQGNSTISDVFAINVPAPPPQAYNFNAAQQQAQAAYLLHQQQAQARAYYAAQQQQQAAALQAQLAAVRGNNGSNAMGAASGGFLSQSSGSFGIGNATPDPFFGM
jgi:hypothetical protein